MGVIKQIDIKNRTCCFYNDIIDLKDFDARLLKIDKKSLALAFTILDISQRKKLMIVKILTVLILLMQVDISKKKVSVSTWFLIPQMKIKS